MTQQDATKIKRLALLIMLCCSTATADDWRDLAKRSLAMSRQQQWQLQSQLADNLSTGRGIALNDLLDRTDSRALPQAHSLAVYLAHRFGHKTLWTYLDAGGRPERINDHFGISRNQLATDWLNALEPLWKSGDVQLCPGGT